ncbi:MAG: four helix bundle protein [Candidatus Dadabacteria bacterium]|nr:MAG: four helix bundle protein [Candidatus Dadabacteria bacterium]
MKTFRTFRLASKFYKLCRALPLKGTMRDQLLRAASSIALNLAEGRGKSSLKDQRRFFHIALGSLRECQAIFILEELEESPAYKVLDSLGAHLYRLIQNMQ